MTMNLKDTGKDDLYKISKNVPNEDKFYHLLKNLYELQKEIKEIKETLDEIKTETEYIGDK
tara:strand:- start:253 stop:435 length:183 start_codon:yes stop_codon:yes gene_type:complete